MSLSLAAIMSEQRLERERAESRRAVEEDELARAIALSVADATPVIDSNSNNNNKNKNDDDDESASLALALQLQAQFEHEDEARRQRAVHEASARWRNPMSKVQVVPQPARLPRRVVHDCDERDDFGADDFYETDEQQYSVDDDDEYYDEDDDGGDDADHRPQLSFNMSRHTGAIKHESKHGSAVTSARNARAIGDFVARSGDMSTTTSGLSNKVVNQLNKRLRRNESRRVRRTNREDTATVDHVLDKHTRLQILNLLNAGTLDEVHGVIATGKESNVYHATGRNVKQHGDEAPREELAVKIFSVTATVFKRPPEVHGRRAPLHAQQFERGGGAQVHSRVGREGDAQFVPRAPHRHRVPAAARAARPRARDVVCRPRRRRGAQAARRAALAGQVEQALQADARADAPHVSRLQARAQRSLGLQLLYDAGELVVIDLSHAISSDNDNASQFLRDDVLNVTRFFADRGAKTLAPRIAFRFIVALEEEEEAAAAPEPEVQQLAPEPEPEPEPDVEGATAESDDGAASQVSVDVAAPAPDDEAMLKLRARCEKRADEALKRLTALVKREGVTARFQDREWTVRDEAFLHEHLPRSLAAIEDETLCSRWRICQCLICWW
jgi:serine/threonine-protein kinase RIO1